MHVFQSTQNVYEFKKQEEIEMHEYCTPIKYLQLYNLSSIQYIYIIEYTFQLFSSSHGAGYYYNFLQSILKNKVARVTRVNKTLNRHWKKYYTIQKQYNDPNFILLKLNFIEFGCHQTCFLFNKYLI